MDSLETLVQDRISRTHAKPADDDDGLSANTPIAVASPEAAVQALLPDERSRDGQLLHGRYRLIERLGAGGFGVVWRARDELLHREVALKRIPLPPDSCSPTGRDEPQSGERASREALAAARLAHPAIVALYEAYVEDDAFYLISELVHGDTLARLIAEGELCDEELLEIGVALAHALAHAHVRGVIHRDVKPQNVLVPHDPGPRDFKAKLTDFGGASLAGEDALTRTGETLGTLAYMAPEQSEGLEIGEPADLYSLALVLYEGFTGVNPVRGRTPAATARRIGRPLPSLAARRPDLPHALSLAIDTALAVDPVLRGSLEELRAALEGALAEGPTRPRRGLLRRRRIVPRPPGPADSPSDSDPLEGSRPPTVTRLAGERAAVDPRRPGVQATATASMAAPAYPLPADVRSRPKGDVPLAQGVPAASRHLPLPRAVWFGGLLALAAWQLASGRPGIALLALAGAAPLLVLGRHPGIGWLSAALAPLLGLAGLAGAFPALAGQPSRWSERAVLGALGYWWLILAGPLLAGESAGTRLWLPLPSGLPARSTWEGSLDSAGAHVVGPVLSAGVLCGAVLWAGGAVVLPWLVRGSSAILDTLAAVVWSAALIAATPYFDAGLSAGATLPHPRGAVLGAVLGAAIAIAARALRGPIRSSLT